MDQVFADPPLSTAVGVDAVGPQLGGRAGLGVPRLPSVCGMPPNPDRAQDLIDALRGSDGAERNHSEQRVRKGDERPEPRFLTMPSGLRGARVGVRPSAVWGAALLVVVVLIVVGVRVAWAERTAQPDAVVGTDRLSATAASATGMSQAEGGETVPASSGHGVQSATASSADLVVHVIGAVHEPGVVTVPTGARVRDVVEAAGGASDEAEVNRVNLARVVGDGERIWVPVIGADPPPDIGVSNTTPESGSSDPGSAMTGLVDINTADEVRLQELPGVGPVTAAAIAEWRAQHGRFSTVDELLEVSGIGPRTLDTLRPLVQIGP